MTVSLVNGPMPGGYQRLMTVQVVDGDLVFTIEEWGGRVDEWLELTHTQRDTYEYGYVVPKRSISRFLQLLGAEDDDVLAAFARDWSGPERSDALIEQLKAGEIELGVEFTVL